MKLSKIKRYRTRHKYLSALFSRNPVLVLGLGLPFAVAATRSLRSGVAMSLEMLVIHLGTMLCALLTCRLVPKRLRVVVNACVSTLWMVLVRLLLVYLFRGITDYLGIYLYLMAVNGMTMLRAASLQKTQKPGSVLLGALFEAAGFSVVVILLGALRELLGAGSLWGVALKLPFRLPGVLVPFFGFILVGFLLAGVRFADKKITAFSILERARRQARFSVVGARRRR